MFSDIYRGNKNFKMMHNVCVNQTGLEVKESLDRGRKALVEEGYSGKATGESLEDRTMS